MAAFSENAQRPEHINENHSPILTTVEDIESISSHNLERINTYLGTAPHTELARIQYANHSPESLAERGLIQSSTTDERFFIMSDIDSRNKFSAEYKSCHGIVVSGVSHDGDRISTMFHINPKILTTHESYDELMAALRHTFSTMETKCTAGSVDVVTFGGTAAFRDDAPRDLDPNLSTAETFRIIHEIISDTANDILGFRPKIADTPQLKPVYGEKHQAIALFDNDTNHLHIIREGSDEFSGSEITFDKLQSHLTAWEESEPERYKKAA